MASMEPFDQLVGEPLAVYLAPVGTAMPVVTAAPAGSWLLLGTTDGGQTLSHNGALTLFGDDDHQGKVKATRPEEDVIVKFTLVGMTLENYRKVLGAVSQVLTVGTTKTMPMKRGATPVEYAMLLRGDVSSPYGAYKAQYELYRGVFDGEYEVKFNKTDRAGLEVEFHVLEDDDQAADIDKMGKMVASLA